jgi:hypothetical protein
MKRTKRKRCSKPESVSVGNVIVKIYKRQRPTTTGKSRKLPTIRTGSAGCAAAPNRQAPVRSRYSATRYNAAIGVLRVVDRVSMCSHVVVKDSMHFVDPEAWKFTNINADSPYFSPDRLVRGPASAQSSSSPNSNGGVNPV